MSHSWLRLLDSPLPDLGGAEGRSAEARLKLAKALNARCRHQEAAALLDQLIAENRSDGEVWFERIVAEGDGQNSEDLEALHRELEALRNEHPESAVPRRNLGYLRILMQRPEAAERALRQALERGQDARALELMGLLCLQRDNPVEARNWFLKSLSVQPKDSRSLRLLGMACEQSGDSKGAEAHFVAALEVDPHYFWGWHSLGEHLIKRGELEGGLRCIHRARTLFVKEPASYFILADCFSELGHLELAQAELHKALLFGPRKAVMAEAYSMLGQLRRDLGDKEGATSYFTLAAETDLHSPHAWADLGDLAREDERWEDAVRCYREALARAPQAADLRVQLGYVLMQLGQATESERSFLAALESDPGEYSAYLGLSEIYRATNRHAEQLRLVEKAMELAPDDADVWNAWGVAMEVNDRLPEATEAYEKALRLSPLHRRAANNLGFAYEKRMHAGEMEFKAKAIEAWKRRLLICRDEGQSMKMATEHLLGLGLTDATLQEWIEEEPAV
ncbi:MAG: tetratricopeptide repeat protein [Firmicutes bacterium]|nr:tetratricopeptide repeat protein [Bacillota bacterium]